MRKSGVGVTLDISMHYAKYEDENWKASEEIEKKLKKYATPSRRKWT